MAQPRSGTARRRWKAPRPTVPTLLHVSRAGRARRLAYALVSIPLGAAYLALFASLVVAVVSSAQIVGLPLFFAVLALARAFGGLERRITQRLLAVQVEDGVRLRRQPGGAMRRLRSLLTASSTWRAIAWLGARTLFTAGLVATVLVAIGLAVALSQYPQWSWFGRNPLYDLAVVALVAVLAILAIRAIELEVQIMAAIAPSLLGVPPQDRMQALRQTSLRLAERNSVARDLHDTIGHTLTASLLQATAARRTLTPGPGQAQEAVDLGFARQALAHIEDNTRTALTELDRALAVLGDRRGTANTLMSDLPAPDLSDIDNLVVGLRDGGLPLTLAVHVAAEDIPATASQLAYRIIQEGTTNVVRHAGCSPTMVEVHRQDAQLLIRVHNASPGRVEPRPGPGGGHGITGLRERASVIGGRLTAGPVTGGGYELCATLPIRELA